MKTRESDDVDIDTFVKGNLPDLADLQNLLHVSVEKAKAEKSKKKKTRKPRREPSPSSAESSESESEELSSGSDDEQEVTPPAKKRTKGGKKSGYFARAGSSRLVSNELFAHAALDDEVGSDKDLRSLSFNLFVAGELEIISDSAISKAERKTRLEVLKMLAYKHEYLSREEVLNQYANFVRKVEKGKYKWGSEFHLAEI